MTKSQNTKNEQQKDLCITSEQLTEQWKKRTLRNGAFYIKMLGGDILPAFCNTEYILKQFQTMKGIYDDVAEVLAPVPSYEEWKDIKSKLQLKETAYDFDTARLEKQNAQLKDLLSDCLKSLREQTFYRNIGENDLSFRYRITKINELKLKIYEVLK